MGSMKKMKRTRSASIVGYDENGRTGLVNTNDTCIDIGNPSPVPDEDVEDRDELAKGIHNEILNEILEAIVLLSFLSGECYEVDS